MKRPEFVNDCYYHVFNRGVDKRNTFMDDKDYRRFLFSLKEFNDENSTLNMIRRFNNYDGSDGSSTSLKSMQKSSMVEIVSYCLMPNHFYFLLKQIKDNGVPGFTRKLGTGYTNYFNKKYERSGSLFQGRYKAILVDKDDYINYLIQYIHLNPLDLLEPDWKEKGIGDFQKAKSFLELYKWSDCRNYDKYNELFNELGRENFSRIQNLIID